MKGKYLLEKKHLVILGQTDRQARQAGTIDKQAHRHKHKDK
jgi:hypothetical protein